MSILKFANIIGLILSISHYCVAQHSNLFINEFMASNVLAYGNIHGDYEDWIEIYNSSASPIDLGGYYLTDNLGGGSHWQIPSGQQAKTTVPASGYLVLYADTLPGLGADHLGFKLKSESGQIVLLDKDNTTILDSINYETQFRDISFGRSPDGSAQWMYMANFTPAAANKQGYESYTMPPTIGQRAGFYQSLTVTVQPAAIGDTIRYTLDGTDPTEASTRYTLPVEITQTSIFKARSFKSGALPSQIITKAFLTTNHDLPVLALMTDPKNLYDPATGIYVNDFDGRAWERFGELEYFENQSLAFYMPTGLRIQGNSGPRDYRKKSFRAYFRTGYGKERLVYPIYIGNPITSFGRLVFRSGYDDTVEPTASGENAKGTLLRDPLVTELWRKIGGLVSRSKFAVLYLNNSYNGIYDIKESVDEHFVFDHLGYRDVDLIRTRWDSLETTYGDKTKWNELVSFFQNNSFTSDEKISEVAQFFDIDDFTDLQALVHGTEYMTWAYGVSMFREKSASGTWQWTIWDADRAYTDVNWNGFVGQYNPIGTYLDNLITKKLLQNQSYKIKYINRIADLLNTTLSSDSMKSIIDSLVQHILTEMPAEVAKWNNTMAKWNENVNSMRTFAEQRPAIVRQQMQNYFSLPGQATLSTNISGNGKIIVNTIAISKSQWSGKYFKNIPLIVTAVPDPGYQFSGWGNATQLSSKTITLNLGNDTTISAAFAQLSNANAELIAPKRIKPGQYFPIVVRIRDANGEINPIEQNPINISYGGAYIDTIMAIRRIAIKRGAGAGYVQINGGEAFLLTVENTHVSPAQKQIEISSAPSISYSGTLSPGEIVWDSTADRLITGDITIPVGCRLTIHPGTWVIVKKYINFYVQGELTVQGTAVDPVVITSEKWSEPWGGMEYDNAIANFEYCMVMNGGGDLSKGQPTPNEGWHTGHQHIFFGKNNSAFTFNQCFFLYSPGKVFGMQDGTATVQNSVSSFVWHGGEFHRVLLQYTNSHLMNIPDDNNASYTEDIDTDGFHINDENPKYPQFSIIDRCYFITGKDDAIDHQNSRLKVSNCWLEDFVHEGVAASGGDTIMVFNTVALNNDQGFEAGWSNSSVTKGPFVFVDHCVAVGNRIDGLRVGDDYTMTYNDVLKVTNTIVYNNRDHNIWNYLYSTHAPLNGAMDISYTMTNDSVYNNSPHCMTGVPQFDPYYYLLPGSPGTNMGMNGTNMGRADSVSTINGTIVINEIMYKAPLSMDSKDWIELYNSQSVNQDLSGWVIKDEDNTHAFIIPPGIIIPSKGYWVLCGDTAAFKQVYPGVNNYTGNISFGFGVKDQVRLYTPKGNIVDSVAYTNTTPWPTDADGTGYTIVLLDAAKTHTLPENWSRSGQYGGSPGRQNHLTDVEGQIERVLPIRYALEQNYPNPFNPATRITFCIPDDKLVTLKIFDLLGREIAVLVNEKKQAGIHSVDWNAVGFPSGVYFYRMQAGSFTGTKKLVLLK